MARHPLITFCAKIIPPSHILRTHREFFIQKAFLEMLRNELSSNYNYLGILDSYIFGIAFALIK